MQKSINDLEGAREAIEAGREAERKVAAIARTRRPTEEESREAREAYAQAARGAAWLRAKEVRS